MKATNIDIGNIDNIDIGNTDDITSNTGSWDPWSEPRLIDTIVNEKSIELIYRQDSQITLTVGWDSTPEIRIFKVIYSCRKGKWHESEQIEGEYISASDEGYEF